MEKSFMDPVHGFIVIDEDWLLALVDTPEFQRLRRIRQLGVSSGTYHGAEHSRFGHSLGVFSIMRWVLQELVHRGTPLEEPDRKAALAAALLHDVGHAPFSHALERVLTPEVGHERWSQAIILGNGELGRRLRAVDPQLPGRVCALLEGTGGQPWLRQLVSSQLDVDRFDYLLRDSLYTGTGYGRFDLERIIHTLRVFQGRLALQIKGLHAAEEYVLARHFMYWRVYLHKTIRCHELLLKTAVRRARALWEQGRVIYLPQALTALWSLQARGEAPWESEAGIQAYLSLDDVDVLASLKAWTRESDRVLADLARRVLNRDLLKPLFPQPVPEVPQELLQRARRAVAEAGWEPEYYCLVDVVTGNPYGAYQADPPIVLVRESGAGGEGEAVDLAAVSPLIRALSHQPQRLVNVYVPAEVRETFREARRPGERV